MLLAFSCGRVAVRGVRHGGAAWTACHTNQHVTQYMRFGLLDVQGIASRTTVTSHPNCDSNQAQFKSIEVRPALLKLIDRLKLGKRFRRNDAKQTWKRRREKERLDVGTIEAVRDKTTPQKDKRTVKSKRKYPTSVNNKSKDAFISLGKPGTKLKVDVTAKNVSPAETKSKLKDQRLFSRLKLLASVDDENEFPRNTATPEIAFAGRSNAGKSTLLNQITASAPAGVSAKPGFTQTLNFYGMGIPSHRDARAKQAVAYRLVMVDMPGYGYADANTKKITAWARAMQSYIQDRKQLRRIFVLLDGRHGLKKIDSDFLRYLDTVKGIKYSCVLTKCDLVDKEDLARRVLKLEEMLKLSDRGTHEVFMTSSRSNVAVEHLKKAIETLAKPPNY